MPRPEANGLADCSSPGKRNLGTSASPILSSQLAVLTNARASLRETSSRCGSGLNLPPTHQLVGNFFNPRFVVGRMPNFFMCHLVRPTLIGQALDIIGSIS